MTDPKAKKGGEGPAWVACRDGCEEFWCRIHDRHASECACPPVEEWGQDPYERGGPP